MTERKIQPGQLYRHFKGNLYQIIGVAKHSETQEKMVVYQALYGDFGLYVRPYDMFVSEVDHDKYPEADQTYRFEQVLQKNPAPAACSNLTETESEPEKCQAVAQEDIPESEEQADPRLMRFLDADTYEEKYQVLTSMQRDMTQRLIDDMSVVLDVVIPDGELMDRYRQLKNCILTMQKYETTRLR